MRILRQPQRQCGRSPPNAPRDACPHIKTKANAAHKCTPSPTNAGPVQASWPPQCSLLQAARHQQLTQCLERLELEGGLRHVCMGLAFAACA